MSSGPEEEAAGHGRLRASRADREQVVDTLKAAFTDGRLGPDELDARVGQALTARTYAELAVATAGLPAAPALPAAQRPASGPAGGGTAARAAGGGTAARAAGGEQGSASSGAWSARAR